MPNEPITLTTTRYAFLQHEIDALELAAVQSEKFGLATPAQTYLARAADLRTEQANLTVEQAAESVRPDIAF